MEIKNYKTIGNGCLLGKFDILIPEWGGLTIHECTVFAKDGKKWICFPSREYQAEGQKKYFHLVRFEQAVGKKLEASALNILEKLMITPLPVEETIVNTDNLPF
jgi:hypothetical protein